MPKAYSVDLRVRVVAAYRDGVAIKKICEQFSVGKTAIYEWDALEKTAGNLEPKYENCGRNPKIEADEKFEKFAKVQAYNTLKTMAESWSATHDEEVSQMAVFRSLKKLGWTRKKRLSATKKRAKKSDKNF